MSLININWKIAIGWFAIFGATTVMLFTWTTGSGSAGARDASSKVGGTGSPDHGVGGASVHTDNSAGKIRQLRSQTVTDLAAGAQLQSLLDAGELNAIHERLVGMADARQLASVGGILKVWCREGSLEIAQWCLVISEESDAALNLKLCSEALSNPSEVIREIAASRLEGASGIRFENSRQAKDWLDSRSEP